MVVNAYSVVAAFAASLRVGIGVLIVILAIAVLARGRRDDSHRPLTVVLGTTLLGLALVSWPLLYLVLQSYVPEWPDVMCIQGVTRIGLNSSGPAAHLPGMITALAFTKPLLVFLAGTWLVLHRATAAAPKRALVALLAFGSVAVVDASIESAYLWIPKQENVVATGCCSNVPAPSDDISSDAQPEHRAGLSVSFFVLGAAVVAALSAGKLLLALPGVAALGPVGVLFLGAVAAPTMLRLPHHACAYCLVASAPESLVGIALFVIGVFAVGWAAVALWVGHDSVLSAGIARVARFGILGSLLFAASGWMAA